jgi:Multidrug resistance efflux pump
MALLPGPRFFKLSTALFVILALMSMSSCSWRSVGAGNRNSNRGGANSDANSDSQNAPIQITVGKSEARNVADVIQATGSLTAQESSDVAPKVAGKVANVYVNVGDFVPAGGTIAKLDDTDARQRVAVAQAAVRQQQAGVRQAEAKLGLARTEHSMRRPFQRCVPHRPRTSRH